jgi:hypothetical protein
MKGLKVSKNYWESLSKMEQTYILNRYSKDGLSDLKRFISIAKKRFSKQIDIFYGYFCVKLKDGQSYKFTGFDTKQFYKIDL